MTLFLGGVVVGIFISIALLVISIIVWRKFIKKKVDDVIFKAGLKAIEVNKERDK